MNTSMDAQVKVTELRSANSPIISFRIILRAGQINDPEGKDGLNALTAELIANGGTKDLTYSQVVEKMYPWAAGMGVQTDHEITTFIADVHRDHLDDFYALISSMLLNPRFDSTDFARIKDDEINGIKSGLRATDDEGLGKEALNSYMFYSHPYGKPVDGTVQGLTAITLQDVRDYYKKTYTQGNMWIGVAGGYPDGFVDKMKKDFSALPAGAFTAVELPPTQHIHDVNVMVVEKPTRAYAVSMGYPIPVTRKDKDYYALMVANSYFGEHRTFNGVLMNHLRGNRGLNYGDYSYVERFVGGLGNPFPDLNTPLRQQYFSIWLRPVQPENTHFAIRNAMYELKKLIEKGITKDDFENTRKFVINYSKLGASTLSRRLGHAMDSEFYGTPYYIDEIEKQLNALTVDDVNAAIKKYLHASDIKIAVVVDEGKGQAFYDALVNNTPSPITYQAKPDQTVLDEDKDIINFPLKIDVVKSRVVKAADLFER